MKADCGHTLNIDFNGTRSVNANTKPPHNTSNKAKYANRRGRKLSSAAFSITTFQSYSE
jgi:hypothetical protein